jgi:hypothetical protein
MFTGDLVFGKWSVYIHQCELLTIIVVIQARWIDKSMSFFISDQTYINENVLFVLILLMMYV